MINQSYEEQEYSLTEPLIGDPSLSKKVSQEETCIETSSMNCLVHTFADILRQDKLVPNYFSGWDSLETTIMTSDNNIIYLNGLGKGSSICCWGLLGMKIVQKKIVTDYTES
jgi:hypothetical protein